MARDFILPKHIITGKNSLEEATLQFGKKALIITDPIMVKLGFVNCVIHKLKADGIEYAVYDSIVGEPTDNMIETGVKYFSESQCDFLIAIGGGSSIDAMKAIGAVLSKGGHINEYISEEINTRRHTMVAIPTTAGTGSEATRFTIITNTQENIKMLLKGNALIPDLAIIDPTFTISSPPQITASTGIDALCHAIESYTSKKAQPLSRTFSVAATKRILDNLPKAFDNGSDVVAREQMSIAALEAGIAFSNSSVTIIHGMSRPIGALYHIPHGLSNAMLMTECLSFAIQDAYSEFGSLAKEIGIASKTESDKKATDILLSEVFKVIKHCHIPTLQEYGVDKGNFIANIPKMAKDAIDSGSPANTIRKCTMQDLESIYITLINKSSI